MIAMTNSIKGLGILVVLIIVAAGALYLLLQGGAPAVAFGNIDVNKAYELISENQNNEDFVLLDVRTDDEVSAGVFGHDAANFAVIDFYNPQFNDDIAQLDKDKTYVIYCRSGNRSGQTFARMQEMGFTNIYNVEGGINAWNEAGLPVEILE